ncbi:MAG TPA: hypothetical protein VOA78_00240 [Candidatus Dormibacteraeota bacterium]|nr:hypothetical protein [Candidatus Dormibacteraeota bacterium]
MKTARLITLIGSIVLLASGLFHATGYAMITSFLAKDPIRQDLASILKASWLLFSVEMLALAIIAFLARSLDRGGPIVLLCAAANAVNGFLLFHFLGPFIGVYLVAVVTLLFLIGGYLQTNAPRHSS